MATQAYWRNRLLTFRDTSISRTQGANFWERCPLLAIASDPSIGFVHHENFADYDTTDVWTLTQATTGAAAISIAASGVLEIDSNSTTATQGANLQRTGGPFIVPAASTQIWFETAVKVVDTFNKVEMYAGLSEVDTAILDSGVMESTNQISFYTVQAAAGAVLYSAEKAGTGDTGAAVTIEEATYVKLGFYVNGVTSVEFFVNGSSVGTLLTANIPIVKLVPSFVCQSDGTNDPITHIKGYTLAVQR